MRNCEMKIDPNFLSRYPVVTFERGAVLFQKGKELKYVYYLIEGICAGMDLTVNGSHVFPLFYHEGEFMGVAKELLMTGSNIPIGNCVAKTKAMAYKVPVEDFRIYIRQYPEVYQEVTKSVINSQHQMLNIAHMRIRGNSVAIVCNCLAALMRPLWRDKKDYYVPSVFTITDISANIQLHRVTVSRIMKRLTEAGIIEKKSYGWKILNPGLLEEYASGEKLFEYE